MSLTRSLLKELQISPDAANASLPLTRNPSTRFGRSAMPHAARRRSSKASGRRLPK